MSLTQDHLPAIREAIVTFRERVIAWLPYQREYATANGKAIEESNTETPNPEANLSWKSRRRLYVEHMAAVQEASAALSRCLSPNDPTWFERGEHGLPTDLADSELDPDILARLCELWDLLSEDGLRYLFFYRRANTYRGINFCNELELRLLPIVDHAAWQGDDWDELEPQVRQLLLYMGEREKADLEKLCPVVWGKDYLGDNGVTENARETLTSKANNFLRKRCHPRILRKVRNEACLRWQEE